jgi:hypothetical protein
MFFITPSHAWYTYGKPGNWPIHERLAMLSLDKIQHTQIFGSIRLTEKANALAQGAGAPDRNKKWMDHEATFRVRNTLCAAMNERDAVMAINRLARGFHYLADNGDPTACNYKNELLQRAHRMLSTQSEYDFWYFTNSARWSQYCYNNDMQVQKIYTVDDLVASLRNMAAFHNRNLINAMNNRDEVLVKDELMKVFSYIRACQNRLVDFLVIEFQNGDAGECRASNPQPPQDVRTVDCSTATKSGQDAPATVSVRVGRNSGMARFSYNLYDVKDRIVVVYAGQTLLDTGCTNGSKTVDLYLSGISDRVIVYVQPACEKKGTQWNFKLECPR